ncbi:MAG: NAD(P)H-dependent glycerol-3-phosphate dehydrogenase [Candidatus Zixiibacteriota bacterium]
MAERVGIIGAGSWGMAMARHLDRKGCHVTLWAYDPVEYRTLITTRGNAQRLPAMRLNDSVLISDDLPSATAGCDWWLLAVPSQFLRSVLTRLPRNQRPRIGLVNLAKGIETTTLMRMSEMIRRVLDCGPESVATVSGPSHAEEVILDMPTTIVAAGISEPFVAKVQTLLSGSTFRAYTSTDVIGVELGGSLKNVIALAAGIVDGLGFGDNTKGALITRGLAEITRLGLAMGARAETFAGLSGLGDLVATCTSRHSRNRSVGERIGREETLASVLASMTMVAEGVETTRSAHALSQREGVEMPITNEVYRVLFDNKPPAEAVAHLMGRTLKAEVWQ